MAKLVETRHYVFIVSTNTAIKIAKNKVLQILRNNLTGVITVETSSEKVVFSPKSEIMVFPK